MTDVHRLERMLKRAAPPQQPSPPAKVIPLARHLRPAAQEETAQGSSPGDRFPPF